MKTELWLSVFLIASAVSLGVGSYFLYVYSLVPMLLSETTIIAVVLLLVLSYFVAKRVLIAINIATVLGVIAPIMSALTPAHVNVLSQLLEGGLIAFLGFLQLMGFYIFPITYIIVRIAMRRTLS